MDVLNQEKLVEETKQHIDQMRRESRFEGAFVHVCMPIINNRRLTPCESNRKMLESLLNPGEEPSKKLYVMLLEQFADRFTWETPNAKPTKEEQRAAFARYVRENNLSGCDANFTLFTQGAELENYARASQAEETAYAKEAARTRQEYLIHHATPDELKAEARFQSQTEHAAAVQADAARREEFVADQQRGLYPRLPLVNGCGERMDAGYFRKISTTDYQLFRALVRRHGTNQITSRLRGEV
jgi:hypothetical protein